MPQSRLGSMQWKILDPQNFLGLNILKGWLEDLLSQAKEFRFDILFNIQFDIWFKIWFHIGFIIRFNIPFIQWLIYDWNSPDISVRYGLGTVFSRVPYLSTFKNFPTSARGGGRGHKISMFSQIQNSLNNHGGRIKKIMDFSHIFGTFLIWIAPLA